MNIVGSLLPVFLVIGLGALLAQVGFLKDELLRNLNKTAYWIGMPALLFGAVSSTTISGMRPVMISAALLGATLISLAVAYLVARLLKLPTTSVGTFVQASFRGNLAFLAFPLSIYVFSRPGAPASAEEMTPIMALAIAPVMIVYAVLAVVVLLAGHQDLTGKGGKTFLRQILINPHVLAVGAGLIVSATPLQVPEPVMVAIKMVGGLAVPAALLGIGGSLTKFRVRSNITAAVGAAVIKIGVTPVAAFLLTRALALPSVDAGVAVVLAAAPTAAVSFVMTTQLRGDPPLASGSIFISTMGSILSLGIAVSLIG